MQNQIVQRGDYIYGKQDEFASPIVVEKFKLIFFLVPGVEEDLWIRMFRRIMGYRDWQTSTSQRGLKHLYDYSPRQASKLMMDPRYTRAMFVRDPKERISIAYTNEAVKMQCCNRHHTEEKSCSATVSRCVSFWELIHICDQPHWRPQGKRMEPKYFETLNFVGHMSTIREDAHRLLTSIGAWDKFGKNGWQGVSTHSSSFIELISSNATRGYNFPGMGKCYGEVGVDYFYQSDYNIKKLNLTTARSRSCKDIIAAEREAVNRKRKTPTFVREGQRMTVIRHGQKVTLVRRGSKWIATK